MTTGGFITILRGLSNTIAGFCLEISVFRNLFLSKQFWNRGCVCWLEFFYCLQHEESLLDKRNCQKSTDAMKKKNNNNFLIWATESNTLSSQYLRAGIDGDDLLA